MKYIDKDAVVARIKKLKMDIGNIFNEYDEGFWKGRDTAFDDAICAINNLEVKEVDLDEEIDNYANEHFSECNDGVLISDANSKELTLLDITPLAKHFFELGLSYQLSWQDVKRLAEIGEAFMNSEESDNLSEEEYYTEILNKFKAQK